MYDMGRQLSEWEKMELGSIGSIGIRLGVIWRPLTFETCIVLYK